eukprot:m.240971 g.240971  ORF g.240971 m.240971 type:complete len:287 (-) comp23835_c0_seq1:16-876(-)
MGVLVEVCGDPTELVHVSDAPHFVRDPYIHTGYRRQVSSHREIAKGVCVLSNEFVNVWSHLVGFAIALGLFINDLTVVFNEQLFSTSHLVFMIYLVTIQVCMLCSAGFHLFGVHSQTAYRRWLQLDYAGISVGIMGCYVPGIYFGFACHQTLAKVYLSAVAALFMGSIYMQLHPDFSSHHWKLRRMLTFAAVLLFGIIPVAHFASMRTHDDTQLSFFLPRVALSYILIGIGFFFYTSRFPESCQPGRYDIIGASHQWWHLFSLFGFLWWYFSCKEFYAQHFDAHCE